jgi:hypothetical protein
VKTITAVVVAVAALAAAAIPAAAQVGPAQPIENQGVVPGTPAFTGAPAASNPFPGVRAAPQNPFMAPNPSNNVHNDTWMTDNYSKLSGPLGNNPVTLSNATGRDCVTLTFDSRGRLVATCTDLAHGAAMYMFDPRTLDVLAFLQLPFVPPPPGIPATTNTTGGAYFFLDNSDRATVAAANRKLLVVGETNTGGKPGFKQVASYNPQPCLKPDERMPSTLPDYKGRLWFIGRQNGTVGVLDRKTGKCGSVHLNEQIENSFAIARDGAYVVSDKAQYKLTAGKDLKVHVAWRRAYGNVGMQKPGQFTPGSGTTPTLMWAAGTPKGDNPAFVAITDNADPMDIVVMRTKDGKVVCTVPVFDQGASDTENSLNVAGRSIFVENNYGYDLGVFAADPNAVSSPGIARVDVNAAGTGCTKVWTSTDVRGSSVVTKADSANGLLYGYENAQDPSGADPWNWVALDMRTGATVWKQRSGYGGLFNNHYAGIALGQAPGGKPTLYLGGIQGVVAVHDG